MSQADELVTLARKQVGDKYVLGAQAKHDDPDPHVFDCSEMVEWLSARAGLKLFAAGDPHAAELYARCERAGTIITVEEARHTPGALVWKHGEHNKPRKIHHVGISAGLDEKGKWHVIEAKGHKWGVVESINPAWSDTGFDNVWNLAAKIPGLDYEPDKPLPLTDAEARNK
jgi:cell wall-associated NlpC family hydrolase